MNGIDFLADTNFLIHLHQGDAIVEPFLSYDFSVSFITEIELLGKFSISKNHRIILKNLLEDCFVIEMNYKIKEKTIWLKERYKIKIPDAIIAASAIEYNIPLITSDKDFTAIKELNLIFLDK